MLVISRKVNEWIDINGGDEAGGLSIMIQEIKGNRTKVAFKAPKCIEISRREKRLRDEALRKQATAEEKQRQVDQGTTSKPSQAGK